jgi:5-methylcytosine-specific restriction endonuclease McrA
MARKDGLHPWCHRCRAKYRLENADRIRERNNKYVADNVDKVKESKKRYAAENKVKATESKKRYVAENKEQRIISYRKYARANQYKHNILTNQYRTKKRELPATLTSDQWELIKKHFNYKCAYCGKETPLTQDHFLALSNGGSFTVDNIVPCCGSCNSSKNNKVFEKWYPSCKYYSKQREEFILAFVRGDINWLEIST